MRFNRYDLFLSLCFIFIGCKKDDDLDRHIAGSNAAVNAWIQQQMKQYYYWNYSLPSKLNVHSAPTEFFQKLVYKEDFFSTILQTKNESTYSKTLANTFGFDFIQVHQSGQIWNVVSQVVPFSQGDVLGLVRGDTIKSINQQELHADNVKAVVQQAIAQTALHIGLMNTKTFQLPASYIAQPVIYKSKVLSAEQAKFGYLYVSYFDFSGAYDFIEAIQHFKREQVQHLILDLRYNLGGQIAFASFCSLLIANIDANATFVKFKGNSKIGNLAYTFKESLSQQPTGYHFQAADLTGKSLKLSRIYVLTSKQTASAAELMINNLRPYIQVTTIGETTLGKDMASMTFTTPAEVNGENLSWHILPLIYKLYNSAGVGDYGHGLAPDVYALEYATLPLKPWGDPTDPLLAAVLHGKSITKQAGQMRQLDPASNKMLFDSNPLDAVPITVEGF